MGFSCGLIGLPNVGKSTLFNALSGSAQAAVANYPFCTIEPNEAEVPVPDPRLDRVAEVGGSAKSISARLGFIDIAGLVGGASRGEGLGNRFLAQIREVDAVAHVLRCFSSPDVMHVRGAPDPAADAEVVNTELLLSDLELAERRLQSLARRTRSGDPEAFREADMIERARSLLAAGEPARLAATEDADISALRRLGFLTAKPFMYLANVDEDWRKDSAGSRAQVAALAAREGAAFAAVSCAVEAELADLDPAERREYLEDLGFSEPGIHRIARIGYELLDLVTFFTANSKEARAWTVRCGATALDAAARVHSDFARGFIRAETISWDLYAALGGETGAREAGRTRSEGRSYVVQDGDVIRFRFNV